VPDHRQRRTPRTAAIAAIWPLVPIAAAAVLPFVAAIGHPLIGDDRALIVENPHVRTVAPAAAFVTSLGRYQLEWYRPLTMYSLAINYAVGGVEPRGYHLVNLALHVINACLVYGIARRWSLGTTPALVAGLFFAVHPIHVEAVVPVAGRADLLATALALLAWWLAAAQTLARWPRAEGAGVCALLAMSAKESAFVIWPVIAAMDLWGARDTAGARSWIDRLRAQWRIHVALAMATAVAIVSRLAALHGLSGDVAIRGIENPLIDAPALVRMATAIWVLGQYLWRLLVPVQLSADYSFAQIPPIATLSDPRLSVVLALVVAFGVAAVVAARRHSPYLALLAIFILSWLPVSNLLFPIGTIMGERLLYLPSVAAALTCGALASQTMRWPRPIAGLVAALAVVAGVAAAARTVARTDDWRSADVLYRVTAETSPHSAKAHFNLAVTLIDRGSLAEAEAEATHAIAIAPNYPEAHNALGTIRLRQQRLEDADAEFRTAIRLAPSMASAWTNLGTSLFRQRRDADARAALTRAIELDPSMAVAYVLLGGLAERAGTPDEAIERYQTAQRLAPDFEGLAAHLADLRQSRARAASGDAARDQGHQ
jgi:Tfp pilus assembly protein PilF